MDPDESHGPQSESWPSGDAGRKSATHRGSIPATDPAPFPHRSRAGDHQSMFTIERGEVVFHIPKRDFIEMLTDPITETVWAVKGHDYRASADLLEEIAEALLQTAEQDRKTAARKEREAKSR